MVRTTVVFFLFLFCCFITNAQTGTLSKTFHNKIDDITSAQQIEALLKSINPYFSTFHVNTSLQFLRSKCDEAGDSLHCNAWFKTDFDNNNFTDLLVIGTWDNHAVFCILDSGNNRFAINRLTRKIFQNCTFPVLKTIGTDNVILYYSFDESKGDSLKVDTLIYRFGDFVEYHSSAKDYQIQEIEFTANGCLGECPQFKLIIQANRNAEYSAIKFNKRYGEFKSVIDEKDYAQLIDLLNYINFSSLENIYRVSWKDDQSAVLKITYDDGKVKMIYDDGLHGTFGLERVYKILFAFRNNQEWH
jgi:hypothetical protein